MKDKGSDYAFDLKSSTLSRDVWTEVIAPFPEEGKAVRQPSPYFCQPGWIVPGEVHPWGTDDLRGIGFVPEFRDTDFDLLVGGVAFY
jgi:hypothetical protein